MSLEALRQEMDAVDRELVAAFCRRMDISGKIAMHKRTTGAPVRDKDREDIILDRVTAMAREPYVEDTRRLYKTILTLSRAWQRTLLSEVGRDRNPMQFPKGGSVASVEEGLEAGGVVFSAPQFVLCASPEAVCRAVAARRTAYGMLPLNVAPLLADYDLYIVRRTEEFLCVSASMQVYDDADRIGLLVEGEAGPQFSEMSLVPGEQETPPAMTVGVTLLGRYRLV